MKISGDTKISDIIKENSEAIEVIASVNKHFRKLKNPFLRKTLGSRVSIKEAATIGGVSAEEIIAKLVQIGFKTENDTSLDEGSTIINEQADMDKDIPEAKVSIRLDVRKQIERGKDPMKKIISASQKLDGEDILLVINKFEPLPIIHLLGERGFSSKVEKLEEDKIYTYFWKKEGGKTAPDPGSVKIRIVDTIEFETKLAEFESLRKIDVRELEMPEPMVRILEETELITKGSALYVDHKKIPQYLLPQLEQRSFETIACEVGPDYIKLLIYKNN